jgi:hypothetical protein
MNKIEKKLMAVMNEQIAAQREIINKKDEIIIVLKEQNAYLSDLFDRQNTSFEMAVNAFAISISKQNKEQSNEPK